LLSGIEAFSGSNAVFHSLLSGIGRFPGSNAVFLSLLSEIKGFPGSNAAKKVGTSVKRYLPENVYNY